MKSDNCLSGNRITSLPATTIQVTAHMFEVEIVHGHGSAPRILDFLGSSSSLLPESPRSQAFPEDEREKPGNEVKRNYRSQAYWCC